MAAGVVDGDVTVVAVLALALDPEWEDVPTPELSDSTSTFCIEGSESWNKLGL